MYEIKNEGPILVVCYTNHALDQFLEGMLSFTRKILRMGSRSKNQKMAEFAVQNVLFRHAPRDHKGSIVSNGWEVEKEIQEKVEKHERRSNRYKTFRDGLAAGVGVLSPKYIKVVDPGVVLPPDFKTAAWLGLDCGRPYTYSEKLLTQIIDTEKQYLTTATAALADEARNIQRKPGKNDRGNKEELNPGREIEDEAAFQSQLRLVDSVYDVLQFDTSPHLAEFERSFILKDVCDVNILSLRCEIGRVTRHFTQLSKDQEILLQRFERGEANETDLFNWEQRNSWDIHEVS